MAGLLARGAHTDVRDNGGYTPMHLAALNSQPEIVRRLLCAGADPTIRTLSGQTAAEVAEGSQEVLHAMKRLERHARSRSGVSLHSRASSATSLKSLWEPPVGSAGLGRVPPRMPRTIQAPRALSTHSMPRRRTRVAKHLMRNGSTCNRVRPTVDVLRKEAPGRRMPTKPPG